MPWCWLTAKGASKQIKYSIALVRVSLVPFNCWIYCLAVASRHSSCSWQSCLAAPTTHSHPSSSPSMGLGRPTFKTLLDHEVFLCCYLDFFGHCHLDISLPSVWWGSNSACSVFQWAPLRTRHYFQLCYQGCAYLAHTSHLSTETCPVSLGIMLTQPATAPDGLYGIHGTVDVQHRMAFFFSLVQERLPCSVSKLFISPPFTSLLYDQGSFVSHFTDAQLRHPDWQHWREKPPFVLKASLQIPSQAISQAWQKEPFLLCYKPKEIIYDLSS